MVQLIKTHGVVFFQGTRLVSANENTVLRNKALFQWGFFEAHTHSCLANSLPFSLKLRRTFKHVLERIGQYHILLSNLCNAAVI